MTSYSRNPRTDPIPTDALDVVEARMLEADRLISSLGEKLGTLPAGGRLADGPRGSAQVCWRNAEECMRRGDYVNAIERATRGLQHYARLIEDADEADRAREADADRLISSLGEKLGMLPAYDWICGNCDGDSAPGFPCCGDPDPLTYVDGKPFTPRDVAAGIHAKRQAILDLANAERRLLTTTERVEYAALGEAGARIAPDYHESTGGEPLDEQRRRLPMTPSTCTHGFGPDAAACVYCNPPSDA